MFPGGSVANRKYCERAVTVDGGVDPLLVDLFADAQTSGGLLIAVASDRAQALHAELDSRQVFHREIGGVIGQSTGEIVVRG